MEMEAEQNDDESYYLSNSPVRKNADFGLRQGQGNKSSALSNNPSNFGQDINSLASV